MKSVMKKMLAVLLAVSLLMPATVFAAATSPKKADIKTTNVTVASKTYNRKNQTTTVTVKAADGTVLKEGVDYTVSGTTTAKKAGKYTVTITGIGKYEGTTTATYQIKKAAQKIKVKGVKKKVKSSVLKKKSVSFKIKTSGIKEKAKITFRDNSKKITVSKSGKVVLKKGLKKGTYKITVYAKSTTNYKTTKKVITIKVR
ncbi:MAG: hypothetical protein Q4D55_11080 [Eubacteriales bacterium]|nr:hypothetical protein [Eubacteriales bacterium]